MIPNLQALDVDQNFIMNIDQMLVSLLLHGTITLNLSGANTISIATLDKHCQWFIVLLAVTASRQKLCPMFIFKSKLPRQIALEKLLHSPYWNRVALSCQDNV
jgi:hypothetical protein